jgi:hypothetical protein
MSESSPADLAVTFRSIARRLNEALVPVGGNTAAVGALPGELEAVIDAAAKVVGTDASTNDIAEAIAGRRADQWTQHDLHELRAQALEAGRLLRAIAAAAESHGDKTDDG